MALPGFVRDPWKPTPAADRILIGACLLFVAFAALQLVRFPFGRDQSIYAVVAEAMRDGGVPYRDVWDFKPPGIFYLHALAQTAFGSSMAAPRLLEALALGSIAAIFVVLSNQVIGGPVAGWLAAALAALFHVQLDFWHSGQPETFGGALAVVAAWLTLRSPRTARTAWLSALGVGFLAGSSFLLKPPLGGFLVVSGVYLWRREHFSSGSLWRPLSLGVALILGLLLPIGGTVMWFFFRGGLPALYSTLFEFVPGYTALGWGERGPLVLFAYAVKEALLHFSPLIPLGLLFCFLLRPVHGRERESVWLCLGFAAVQLSGVAMQAKFFQYHYGATLPLLAWIAGIGLYKVWLRLRPSFAARALFLLGVLLLTALPTAVRDLHGSFWQRAWLRLHTLLDERASREAEAWLYTVADFNLSADRAVGDFIAGNTVPNDAIHVWGFEPAIYYFANRDPASRYIYNVPQRVTWEREWAREELLRDLRQAPAYVVVQRHDVFSFVTGDNLDSERALATFPELQRWLEAHYVKEVSIEDFDLYRRRN